MCVSVCKNKSKQYLTKQKNEMKNARRLGFQFKCETEVISLEPVSSFIYKIKNSIC